MLAEPGRDPQTIALDHADPCVHLRFVSATAPIDRDIAALRAALSDSRVRRRAINAGVPMRTVQNFLAGGQPSVQTIRLLQSVGGPSAAAQPEEGAETDGELAYDLIALAARARYLTERIDETVARVDALGDRLGRVSDRAG